MGIDAVVFLKNPVFPDGLEIPEYRIDESYGNVIFRRSEDEARIAHILDEDFDEAIHERIGHFARLAYLRGRIEELDCCVHCLLWFLGIGRNTDTLSHTDCDPYAEAARLLRQLSNDEYCIQFAESVIRLADAAKEQQNPIVFC